MCEDAKDRGEKEAKAILEALSPTKTIKGLDSLDIARELAGEDEAEPDGHGEPPK